MAVRRVSRMAGVYATSGLSSSLMSAQRGGVVRVPSFVSLPSRSQSLVVVASVLYQVNHSVILPTCVALVLPDDEASCEHVVEKGQVSPSIWAIPPPAPIGYAGPSQRAFQPPHAITAHPAAAHRAGMRAWHTMSSRGHPVSSNLEGLVVNNFPLNAGGLPPSPTLTEWVLSVPCHHLSASNYGTDNPTSCLGRTCPCAQAPQ